jgi:hypothetical protein
VATPHRRHRLSLAIAIGVTLWRYSIWLSAAKEAGKRICGYGAPGKGNTLLNYCGIGTDFPDVTVDRNPYKHGRYMPDMHIPIKPVEAIDAAHPDYILVLPWNLKQESWSRCSMSGRGAPNSSSLSQGRGHRRQRARPGDHGMMALWVARSFNGPFDNKAVAPHGWPAG